MTNQKMIWKRIRCGFWQSGSFAIHKLHPDDPDGRAFVVFPDKDGPPILGFFNSLKEAKAAVAKEMERRTA
jgi:hypothetical protein